ncbi:helix-turn-helix domain-containing protein [Rhizobium sp. BK376]|uniref:winged helix-turn-helix transcriptional regulator n=1 Tax=Rhizobium sp. BK376 TaxID=2512149 RepID=UPI0014043B61|nr:helix-turn-helix domain-containing protein [Rhizobium sp. BK376]
MILLLRMNNSVDFNDDLVSRSPADGSTHREVRADAATCPLGLAINTIGGRWKLHILRSLLLVGPLRYNALLSAIVGISPKELTRNLRELEAARLIERVAVEGQSAYGLTALGQEIEGPFRALGIFGTALARRRDPF